MLLQNNTKITHECTIDLYKRFDNISSNSIHERCCIYTVNYLLLIDVICSRRKSLRNLETPRE